MSQLHQFLGPLLSIILTVPLGPHPPSSTSGQPSPFDLRNRAADVLAKLVVLYGKGYPGLVPRLLSTFTRALHSSPFPSPLGAEHPPSGRYEGAVLGINALGGRAVKDALWGQHGENLEVINNLVGILYPGDRRVSKTGLMRATLRAFQALTSPKPVDWVPAPVPQERLASILGRNVAKALEKRPWMGVELARLHDEGGGEAEEDGDVAMEE